MLKRSELEMASRQAEYDRFRTERGEMERKHSQDIKQLENVIIELQNDL